ncbi:malto-oligosyltrehalose synthase [Dyadobacter sandarakinus]|uniref:4-alpha-glucanotransferase n=1 Tax=Dyadobacter sandarakinus TaxID=2747268 RepID=A0ABX7I135_9BACT|nr:malto-oligosyltrehalose synthase [Dyadobacter sandarakinus]QRQ99557.1 malto-oligosyltrehalose synthase [Dyadobacter sandarakinus]
MNSPIATYRLQFHKDFTLEQFEKLVPYFRKLGVGTIYASPILESSPGSTHGYDGINPHLVNPEIGTIEQLRTISQTLRKDEIGWLQDIVPNHMAFTPVNPWIADLLEKGPRSRYAKFFDVSGNSALFTGKLMVPFLGNELEDEIRDGNISLALNTSTNKPAWKYFDEFFPVSLSTYQALLTPREGAPDSIASLSEQFDKLHEQEAPAFYDQAWNELMLQFNALLKNPEFAAFLNKRLEEINADPEAVTELLGQQEYELCFWQHTAEKINFRRFFTVNGLICLNIQDDQVFETYHELIRELVDDGTWTGLRIDHIDGLYDPEKYLQDLRTLTGGDAYIVVEKILEKDEQMPVHWEIQGTSGYEFLADVNNVFTSTEAEKPFTDFYRELTGDEREIKAQLLDKKSDILYKHMGGELDNLYQLFVRLQLADQEVLNSIGADELKRAIGALLIYFPVYRYYGNQLPLPEKEQTELRSLFDKLRENEAGLTDALHLLEKVLMGTEEDEAPEGALEFYQRLMQFSGPLMAKGGEDTLMYTYNRFIGHNDVGDFPDRFGMTVKDFHARMRRRQKEQPFSLNTTSTHDTKRGEDVRARLNVLTDLADEWLALVKECQEMNQSDRGQGPDLNDEYLIYQTIVGAYPMPGSGDNDFADRLEAYLQKALREGKTNSDWAEPNEAYEKAAVEFAQKLLEKDTPFQRRFAEFQSDVIEYGIINSLAQVVLKFTCPGIPDVYQGCELWDLSLVDPDNRRPVDYALREKLLTGFADYDHGTLLSNLWENRHEGGIKLWLTTRLFELRKEAPLIFTGGEYIPLTVRGTYKNNVLAFARKQKKDFYIIAVPLHIAQVCHEQQTDFFGLDWKDTNIVLPDNLSPEWLDIFTEKSSEYQGKLVVADLFKTLPAVILKGTRVDNERKAGVLLHISSLASPFGVGDLGPEAYAFADFLARSNQKLWQILPLNPIEAAQANSPYSALSSRAGNYLLISPEQLAAEGLLDADGLQEYHLPQAEKADFDKAGEVKAQMLKKAFEKSLELNDASEKQALEEFAEQNADWLPDFCLYMVLKEKHEGSPWFEWTPEFRKREESALSRLKEEAAGEIRQIAWQQYIFNKQWKNLHSYCKERGIELLGDIPFYVSYDSADVWSHRDLFRVDEEGKITGVAGVPPDAFSDDGQLWGMPVFNWDALKESGYHWWIRRLAKNMELFDISRLDHFRAFADYWEVPGGEKTAVNGTWQLGPGEEFFAKAETELGSLPFIAEDLGEMSPAVYVLRDKFSLPGMKVAQFAFDENMPQSDHIPHNYKPNFIAYTGTHDNNTTRGWLRQSADEQTAERVSYYAGYEVNEENVSQAMSRMVFGSVAKWAIIPMQDVLNLDESAIMNIPGSSEDNWSWRLTPGQITKEAEQWLTEVTVLFNRD